MIRIYGVAWSPYVRKVLLTLEYKGIDYELNPVFPGSKDEAFRRISPLGKIPLLEHNQFTSPDSKIICRYLERVFPENPIYPTDPIDEARALWIEEYCDTKLMQACGGLFFQRVLGPRAMDHDTDELEVTRLLEVVMPDALDYLESLKPESGTLIPSGICIADFALVASFVQAQYGGFEVDGASHPNLRTYLDRSVAHQLFRNRLDAEVQPLALLEAAGLVVVRREGRYRWNYINPVPIERISVDGSTDS